MSACSGLGLLVSSPERPGSASLAREDAVLQKGWLHMKRVLLLSFVSILLGSSIVFCQNCDCPVLVGQKYTCQAGSCEMRIHAAYCGSQNTNCEECINNADFVQCCNQLVAVASSEGYPCDESRVRARFAMTSTGSTRLVAATCSGHFTALVFGNASGRTSATELKGRKPPANASRRSGIGDDK